MSKQYDPTKTGQQAETLGGVHTTAVLNTLYTNVPAGSTAYSSDQGPVMFNGISWGSLIKESPPRINNFGTHRLISWTNYGSISSSVTFQQVYAVPFTGPMMVRLVYENDSTSQNYSVFGAAAAGGSAFADINPLLTDGASAAPWTVASTPPTVPVADASVATNDIFGSAATDWMLINIPARRDGKTFGLVYVRSIFNANARCMILTPGDGPAYTALAGNNYQWVSSFQSGNFVNSSQTNYAASGTGTAGAPYVPFYPQFQALGNVRAWMNIGDSYSNGNTTTSQQRNYVTLAADALANLGNPIVIHSLGQQGQTLAFFDSRATTDLANALFVNGCVAFIQPFSINTAGSYTQANVNAAWIATLNLATLISAKGGTPIIKTMPANGLGSTQDALRQTLNASIRNGTLPYVDVDLATTNGNSPANFAPGYSTDGVHLNDAGHAAVVPYLLSALAKYGLT